MQLHTDIRARRKQGAAVTRGACQATHNDEMIHDILEEIDRSFTAARQTNSELSALKGFYRAVESVLIEINALSYAERVKIYSGLVDREALIKNYL